jgi:UDP-3-O-[3-hydroxymyristoyl] glucosamine N-acyltransferase
MITAEVIKNLHAPEIHYHSGDLHRIATKVLPPESCDAESLVFVSKPDQLEQALAVKAPIIVAFGELSLPASSSTTFFTTSTVPMAMSLVLPLFDGKMNRFNQAEKIHPLSFVHPLAHLGKNVTIGPFVTIGEGARIGDSCTIGANTVVESFAVIGDHTLLHPLVFIGAHCELGVHCEIQPHTTIGGDGFSYARSPIGEHKKIPQIGRVILGDHVEIGANCAIDRAALTETRIGNGTKLDNFAHIAHNVRVGKNAVTAAGFRVAGSSTIGDNLTAGGDVSITDHVDITDNVILAGRAGITNDITKAGAYGGYPLEPLRDSLRTLSNLTQVSRLRKQMREVFKHLNLTDAP